MNNTIPTLKYAWLTLKHKFFVFRAGIKIGVSFWRLLTHDLSKFSPKELPHYGRQFFGDKSDPKGFMKAWIHHQNSNDHHWEYWIPRTGHNRATPPYPDNEPVEMPTEAVKEMVADWMGASRAYNGQWPKPGNWEWYDTHWEKIKPKLHEKTALFIEQIMVEYELA